MESYPLGLGQQLSLGSVTVAALCTPKGNEISGFDTLHAAIVSVFYAGILLRFLLGIGTGRWEGRFAGADRNDFFLREGEVDKLTTCGSSYVTRMIDFYEMLEYLDEGGRDEILR